MRIYLLDVMLYIVLNFLTWGYLYRLTYLDFEELKERINFYKGIHILLVWINISLSIILGFFIKILKDPFYLLFSEYNRVGLECRELVPFFYSLEMSFYVVARQIKRCGIFDVAIIFIYIGFYWNYGLNNFLESSPAFKRKMLFFYFFVSMIPLIYFVYF